MNISQSPQPLEIYFTSTTGQQKVLTSRAGTESIRAIRAEALENLYLYRCIVCLEVLGKPLQTRCCTSVLCAFCYNHLETPKTCPNDRRPFTGNLSRDLLPMGRPVNNQIERLMRHFTDIEATGTDTIKSEAQQAALATLEGRPAGGTAIPEPSRLVNSLQGHSSVQNAMAMATALLSAIAPLQVPAIPPVDTRPLSSNYYTQLFRHSTRQMEHHGDFLRQSGSSSSGLRQASGNFSHSQGLDPGYNYPLYMIEGIEIFSDGGRVELIEQLSQPQPTVTVIAPTAPERKYSGYLKVTSLGTDDNVIVKLPQAFAQHLIILSGSGDIITGHGYRIKHGGIISSMSGNIRIAVDSTRVTVETVGPDVEVTVANHNEPLGQRTKLYVRSPLGKIRVTDR